MLDRVAGERMLTRIDGLAAELAALRAELEAQLPPAGNGLDGSADDFAPEHLLEVSTASERFGVPCDTLRLWARTAGCGRKAGGRWVLSALRLRRHLRE